MERIMKIFRTMLFVACFCFLSQNATAEEYIVRPGKLPTVIDVGNMSIKVSNFKSEHTVVIIDNETDQIKMYLDFILPGFKSGMFFDGFGGKKVTISCERHDIKVEIK